MFLACMLVWSSVRCVAVCTGEVSRGKVSSELPCHHHGHDNQPARSCANQQFPQFDSPQVPSIPAPHVGVYAVDAAVFHLTVGWLHEGSSAFMLRALRPPGGVAVAGSILRI